MRLPKPVDGSKSVLRCAYGLACSVNFDWSWCPSVPGDQHAELKLSVSELNGVGPYPDSAYAVRAQRPARAVGHPPVVVVDRSDDGHVRVSYRDGAQFFIDRTRSEVVGLSRSDLTVDDLLVYMQGPIMGFLLRLRGVICLHASAAVVDGKAIAVVGNGGMGKSTSAAIFAKLGLPVLTDDVLALRDRELAFDVQPGLPRVLLWPESVAALFGDTEALPRLVSTWNKRYLDLSQHGYRFAQEPTPLGAIYILGERLNSDAMPEITELTGVNALMKLVGHTYANDFLDATQRAAELEVLSRLVQQVPIRMVQAPNDRVSAPRVCEALISDFRSVA